jgi:hypothetical protein
MNCFGLVTGTIYNANTPDFYSNNAHHKMGWIVTWISLAWILLGIVNTYAAKSSSPKGSSSSTHYYSLAQEATDATTRRWSDDSGNGASRQSSICTVTPPASEDADRPLPEYSSNADDDAEDEEAEKPAFLQGTRVDRFMSQHVQKYAIGKTLTAMKIFYLIIERTILFLAFALVCSGLVTFGGVFVSLALDCQQVQTINL